MSITKQNPWRDAGATKKYESKPWEKKSAVDR
jgi:hypothetical protein